MHEIFSNSFCYNPCNGSSPFHYYPPPHFPSVFQSSCWNGGLSAPDMWRYISLLAPCSLPYPTPVPEIKCDRFSAGLNTSSVHLDIPRLPQPPPRNPRTCSISPPISLLVNQFMEHGLHLCCKCRTSSVDCHISSPQPVLHLVLPVEESPSSGQCLLDSKVLST